MPDRVSIEGLQVAAEMAEFINTRALPGTGVDPAAFWRGFSALLHDMKPQNRALLARRDDWRERFETFYARRPHPVFVRVPDVPRWTDLPSHVEPFTVTLQDIADVVSFIETLEPK